MSWKAYLYNLLLTLDTLGNVLLRGLPGMTLSGRAETARRSGKAWGCVVCAYLDRLKPGHCKEALANDVARAQSVIRDALG